MTIPYSSHFIYGFSESIQAAEIADPRVVTLVSETDGKLIGFAQLRWEHKLPGLLSPMLSFKVLEPKLWPVLKYFYKEVRNPLFHGMQLQSREAAEPLKYLRLIEKVYEWIDHWHTPLSSGFPQIIVLKRKRD